MHVKVRHQIMKFFQFRKTKKVEKEQIRSKANKDNEDKKLKVKSSLQSDPNRFKCESVDRSFNIIYSLKRENIPISLYIFCVIRKMHNISVAVLCAAEEEGARERDYL